MRKIHIDKNWFYEVYTTKSNRTIFIPCTELKLLQRMILNIIKTTYNIKLNTKIASSVHCNQKWILKLDIKDFYNSVSKELIKKAINKIYCNIELAQTFKKEILYKICTVNDKLPTGAVTSTHLANIAFELTNIDDRLLDYCKKEHINYSRYMDDLFFSCSSKEKLNEVEILVNELLNEAGFYLNHEKTKYISDNKRQEVLGLVVNNKNYTCVSVETKRKYRSILFNYLKAIYFEERLGVGTLFLKKIGYQQICGYLSYIKNTDTKFYSLMQKFILSKIKKFGLDKNAEVKKLKKVIK